MNELSLFSGAGGGLLGTYLLGWRAIGYVEFYDYCQRVIAQRIRDGILPNAPIFGDIRTFLSSGCAELYRGVTDVITAGFPCQPFSVAGKRAGSDDERNMWPATIDTIRVVRPRYCLLENVPGLLTSGYFGTILGDLAESGYDARWRVLSAAELGAPHRRDRLWIVGYTSSDRRNASGNINTEHDRHFANSASQHAGEMAHAYGEPKGHRHDGAGKVFAHRFTPNETVRTTLPDSKQWATEPDVGRVANGVASRVDRLKAAGNGQVPAVARTAWRLLTEELSNG